MIFNDKVNTSGVQLNSNLVKAAENTGAAGNGEKGGGLKGSFDWKAGLMSAIPMATEGLSALNEHTLRNLNTQQRQEYNAIYGRGEDPIFDLFSLGSDTKKIANQINLSANRNSGVSSNQGIIDTYKSIDFNQFKPTKKITFSQGLTKNLEAFGKGASMGSSFGPWGALIGGIVGGLADFGSYIGSGKRRNYIDEAKKASENLTLNSIRQMSENTDKQSSLHKMRVVRPFNYGTQVGFALGGSLDYDLQNQYAINNYIDTMNRSKISSLPNSFYKPQFEGMNYYAMGGMPDFNEFNTGGTHEQNPIGGIPQGFNNEGILNTVEQGETKAKMSDGGTYIYSHRLIVPDEDCDVLKLPHGITYADASKLGRKEYDEKPNDEIAKKGWEWFSNYLTESQERQKQEKAIMEAQKAGQYSSKTKGMQSDVLQELYSDDYNEYSKNSGNPYARAFGGYTDFPFSQIQHYDRGWIQSKSTLDPNFEYYKDGAYDPDYVKWLEGTDFTNNAAVIDFYNKNDNVKNAYTQEAFIKDLPNLGQDELFGNVHKLLGTLYGDYLASQVPETTTVQPEVFTENTVENTNEPEIPDPVNPITQFQVPEFSNRGKNAQTVESALSLLHNITSPVDYSTSDAYFKEMNKISNAYAPKSYNYIKENPVNIAALMNEVRASNNSLLNAIRNRTSPSLGADLLAAGYQAMEREGKAFNNALDYNMKDRNNVAAHNSGIEFKNIANDLQAQQLNAQKDGQKHALLHHGITEKNRIDTSRGNAISQSAQDLFKNLRAGYEEDMNKRMSVLDIMSRGINYTPEMKGLMNSILGYDMFVNPEIQAIAEQPTASTETKKSNLETRIDNLKAQKQAELEKLDSLEFKGQEYEERRKYIEDLYKGKIDPLEERLKKRNNKKVKNNQKDWNRTSRYNKYVRKEARKNKKDTREQDKEQLSYFYPQYNILNNFV